MYFIIDCGVHSYILFTDRYSRDEAVSRFKGAMPGSRVTNVRGWFSTMEEAEAFTVRLAVA